MDSYIKKVVKTKREIEIYKRFWKNGPNPPTIHFIKNEVKHERG